MFKQYIGSSPGGALYCALCPDEQLLIYIKRTGEYKCPNCGEVADNRSRFTKRKTKLIAPNALENQSLHLSQVTTDEFMSRNSLPAIKNNKFSNPVDAWNADV